ncbi:MAG: TMEM175 family protein, partial [Pseudolysinimonas sp.]
MADDVRTRYANLLSRGEGTDRIQFFSDAVFAIAMTLLVLEIRLPESLGSGDDVDPSWADIGALWPQFFAYALSFAIIGLNWVTHHRKFLVIVRFDALLVTINLILLGFVALLPFPTSVLADYGNNTPVVVLYAFNVGIITVLQFWLWVHAYRAGLTERLDDDVYLLVKRNLYPVPIIMGASIIVAFFSPLIAMLMWILIWPASQLVDRIGRRAASPKPTRRSRGSAS